MKRIDLPSGTVVGRYLTSTGRSRKKHGALYWECLCVCGNLRFIPGTPLRKGHRTSCGCKNAPPRLTHGQARRGRTSRALHIWRGMLSRCYKPSSNVFRLYGERGIVVSDRWKTFSNFLFDMGTPPEGHTLDRIDSNGNYESDNCRWSTPTQQARNTRANVRVVFAGRPMALAEAAELSGLPYSTVQQRISKLGWTPDRALTTPHRSQRHA